MDSITSLLKKNYFSLTPFADQSFQAMKEVMFTTSVLSLLDFTKTFVLECDASGRGIRVVLMQCGQTLAFKRK
jgi:hypothetical protein